MRITMRAEQTTTCVYWPGDSLPVLETQVGVRMELPGEEGNHVETRLSYKPELPESLWDTIHQAVYDGVHGGITAVGDPLPPGGVVVNVVRLQLVPIPDQAVMNSVLNVLPALSRRSRKK